jgi:tetratricopeptide (TPR) repeat protein
MCTIWPRACRGLERYEKAERLYQRALAIRSTAPGVQQTDLADSLIGLGRLYVVKDEFGKAEPLFKQALSILQKVLGPDHLAVADLLDDLADLYVATQRDEEAAAARREEARILQLKR